MKKDTEDVAGKRREAGRRDGLKPILPVSLSCMKYGHGATLRSFRRVNTKELHFYILSIHVQHEKPLHSIVISSTAFRPSCFGKMAFGELGICLSSLIPKCCEE